jgi:hypothetical protein
MNNSTAGSAMTPPVCDGTWLSVTPCEQMISSPSTAEVLADEMLPLLFVHFLYYTAGLRFGTDLHICNATSYWRYQQSCVLYFKSRWLFIFWIIAPCSMAEIHKHFSATTQ